MNKGNDQITKLVLAISLMPPREEDQDSNDSNEDDDLTRGPSASDREKSAALFEDYEDTPSDMIKTLRALDLSRRRKLTKL